MDLYDAIQPLGEDEYNEQPTLTFKELASLGYDNAITESKFGPEGSFNLPLNFGDASNTRQQAEERLKDTLKIKLDFDKGSEQWISDTIDRYGIKKLLRYQHADADSTTTRRVKRFWEKVQGEEETVQAFHTAYQKQVSSIYQKQRGFIDQAGAKGFTADIVGGFGSAWSDPVSVATDVAATFIPGGIFVRTAGEGLFGGVVGGVEHSIATGEFLGETGQGEMTTADHIKAGLVGGAIGVGLGIATSPAAIKATKDLVPKNGKIEPRVNVDVQLTPQAVKAVEEMDLLLQGARNKEPQTNVTEGQADVMTQTKEAQVKHEETAEFDAPDNRESKQDPEIERATKEEDITVHTDKGQEVIPKEKAVIVQESTPDGTKNVVKNIDTITKEWKNDGTLQSDNLEEFEINNRIEKLKRENTTRAEAELYEYKKQQEWENLLNGHDMSRYTKKDQPRIKEMITEAQELHDSGYTPPVPDEMYKYKRGVDKSKVRVESVEKIKQNIVDATNDIHKKLNGDDPATLLKDMKDGKKRALHFYDTWLDKHNIKENFKFEATHDIFKGLVKLKNKTPFGLDDISRKTQDKLNSLKEISPDRYESSVEDFMANLELEGKLDNLTKEEKADVDNFLQQHANLGEPITKTDIDMITKIQQLCTY